MKVQLEHKEPSDNATADEFAKVLVARFGLSPRKSDASAQFHRLLLELSERKKSANRDKRPEVAVMPVEEMGSFAGIRRQTMYDYLHRWLDLQILKKTSFVASGKVIIGYELNGQNIEGAFRKAETCIKNHLDASFKLVEQLQSEVKKEKLRAGTPDESETPESTVSTGSLP